MTPEQREKEQQQRLAVLMSGGRFDNNGISEGLSTIFHHTMILTNPKRMLLHYV